MSSATVDATAQPTVIRYPGTSTTTSTSEAEGDHLVSIPGIAQRIADIPNDAKTGNQWNGDPMDWESWPTGRPGPFVSEARMQVVMDLFQDCNGERNEQSRTEENVLHIAEFSSSGRGEPELYCNSPEK